MENGIKKSKLKKMGEKESGWRKRDREIDHKKVARHERK